MCIMSTYNLSGETSQVAGTAKKQIAVQKGGGTEGVVQMT